MRCTILSLTAVLCLALVNSHPLPEDGLRSEALDRLVMAEADNEAALRSKRTIGILRQLFPEISQRIEEKVNMIVAQIIRAVGPTLLQTFLGGGNNRNNNNVDTAVTGVSPFDDEDEDDLQSSIGSNGSKVSLSLPSDEGQETGSTVSSSTLSSTTSSNDVDVTALTTVSNRIQTTIPSQTGNEVVTTELSINSAV